MQDITSFIDDCSLLYKIVRGRDKRYRQELVAIPNSLKEFWHKHRMSKNPKGRTADTKKLAEKNISEGEPPLHKEDPTQPAKAEDASSSAKEKTSSDSPVEL